VIENKLAVVRERDFVRLYVWTIQPGNEENKPYGTIHASRRTFDINLSLIFRSNSYLCSSKTVWYGTFNGVYM